MSEQPKEFRVTVAVGAALLAQTAAALLWAGAAAERLDALERRTADEAALTERMARLEEQTRAVRASLERIEAKVDRLEAEERR